MGENKNWSRAGKIASRMAQLWQRVTSHPVELIVLLHATVAAMVNGSSWWQQPANYAAFAVTAAFCLSFYRTRWWAKAGYWGVLPLYALCVLLPRAWSGSAEFGILTALLPAAYMLTRRKADTDGPLKSLRAYQQVELNAGESRTLTIDLPRRRFETWDTATNTMRVVPGVYELMVGSSSADRDLQRIDVTVKR